MRDRTRDSRKDSRKNWGKCGRLGLSGPLALAALLAMSLATPAWAQDDEEDEDPFAGEYRKPGLYLVAMGNYMFTTDQSGLEDEADRRLDGLFGPPNRTDASNSWGFNGRAGYRAHERVAIETQFEFLNGIDLDSDIGNLSVSQETEITLFALTGNARGYLMSRGRVQPYVLAGAGWGQSRTNFAGSSAKERDDGFVARFGAGIDLYGKPDIAVTLEASYVMPTGNLDDLEYVTIGAGFMLRFFPGGS